jgi:hypothetical protein
MLAQYIQDIIYDWKVQYDESKRVIGQGQVENKWVGAGNPDTWEVMLKVLTNEYDLGDTSKGEVPLAWMESCRLDFLANRATNEYGRPVPWYKEFYDDRKKYLDEQQSLRMQAMVTEGSTIMSMAERAAAKSMLDLYAYLIKNYGNSLSQSEKEFMNYFWVEWRTQKSDADVAKAEAILKRINFQYPVNQDVQQRMSEVQQAAYEAFLKSGGKQEDWDRIMAQTNDYIASQTSKSSTEVVSNGGGNGLTAMNWNTVQANQKVVSDMKDSTYINPLQTMFLRPDTRQETAAAVSEVDFSELNKAAEGAKAAVVSEAGKVSPLTWLGIGFIALKLFGR